MTNVDQPRKVAEWILQAQRAIAFTGAGISTESGIPDFRSPGGVWSRREPVYFDQFLASAEARYRYWQQKCEDHRDFASARPNAGHNILADWERQGRIGGVITQNIDGLHQMAGSQNVIELHGTARQVACLSCGYRTDADPFVAKFLQTDQVPACPRCEGLMKHATISFGQALPAEVLAEATRWCLDCDLVLAMGSSWVVSPAADLPTMAHQNGARLVIINRDETGLDTLADFILRGSIGATLNEINRWMQSSPQDSRLGPMVDRPP